MLGDTDPRLALSPSALQAACELDYFLAENAKSARQFLKGIAHPRTLRELQIECFDKDSNAERAAELLQPLLTGRSAGVLSKPVVPRWPIRARCWSPLRIVCASASCRTSVLPRFCSP